MEYVRLFFNSSWLDRIHTARVITDRGYVRARTGVSSLVPRPFLQGRGKTARAPLLAHARRSHKNMEIRARLYFVRLHISNLP